MSCLVSKTIKSLYYASCKFDSQWLSIYLTIIDGIVIELFNLTSMCTLIFCECMISESGIIRNELVESMTNCKSKPLLKHENIFFKFKLQHKNKNNIFYFTSTLIQGYNIKLLC